VRTKQNLRPFFWLFPGLKARSERTKLLEKLEQIIESELMVNLVEDSLNITVYSSSLNRQLARVKCARTRKAGASGSYRISLKFIY
jgi:hypothetical protein